MESILSSIKKMLGIQEEYTHFDADIIMHINSVFMILNQLGVGPAKTYAITGNLETWSNFVSSENTDLNVIKTYMYLKVKMMFDPPSSSAMIESMDRQISEYEWRLNVAAESQQSSGEEVSQNG